jgi:uncharacterized repeat protein (TIGR02543 family)
VLFGGWYTDNNTFQNEFTASTAVNGSFTVYAKWRAYAIGETGPAGGYIFYDNGTIHADGWRYLEAAPESTETGAQWGSKSHDIDADGTAIGTGQANTNLIVAALTTLGETGRAAQICDALEFGGYNDWFLPSQDELKEMYEHKTSAMGYSSSPYWSSTEGYAGYAFNLMFAYGSLSQVEKDRSGRVRAARRF